MKAEIKKSRLRGTACAPPSKSFAHRMLICAALAEGESCISGVSESEDMLATLDCIEALGASYRREGDTVAVTGRRGNTPEGAIFNCRESGSTLRFLIPPALTGDRVRFTGAPRLLERGIGIYETLLGEKGIEIKKDALGIELRGELQSGEYVFRGDVSSQFATGLLFALPTLRGASLIRVLPPVESRPYIDISLAVLRSFGVEIGEPEPNVFSVRGGQRYIAGDKTVEGDWSNAAALLAFNSVGGDVAVTGLNDKSIQGDRVCAEYLGRLGGVEPIDLSACPDLGPVLFAAAAAVGKGAKFVGTRRLRIKESDRAAAMAEELSAFGVKTELGDNSALIFPSALHAPTRSLQSHNDHRIVMALTLLCSVTGGVINGAEAVRKSYPDFFSDLETLGLEVNQSWS